jgi:non-ribosomal peptide synthase protein (TIGR01720 family)
VVFNYFGQLDQDFAQVPFRFSKEGTGEIQDVNEQREHELYITGVVEGKEFSLRVEYSGARFHAATIAAFLENYKLALHAVIEHCCAAVAV